MSDSGNSMSDYIPKSDLKDWKWYWGKCRNAEYAYWNANEEQFWYIREKFGGHFWESIRHPEDDDGSDMFVPLKEVRG